MSSSVKVDGFERLKGRLQRLPRRVAGPIAAKAIKAGLKVIVNAIRQISPPFIRPTIGYRLVRKTRPMTMGGIVGVNVGRHADYSERWAPIQVVGSNPRFRKTRSGRVVSTGVIIANDVVGRGVSASSGEAMATVRSIIKNELKKLNR